MNTNKETKLTLHARPISPTAVVECTVLMTPPPPPRKKEVAVLKKKSDVMDSDTLSDEAAEELLLQMIEIGISQSELAKNWNAVKLEVSS